MEQDLAERRQQSESLFNELIKQKDQKQQEINDIEAEMARLQGEWRLINDLLDKKPKDKKSKISPKANIIDTTGVEGS